MVPFRKNPFTRSTFILPLTLGVMALAAACAGPQSQPATATEIQTRCTVTYAGGIPSHTFTVGQPGSVEGAVLADGDCGSVGQSIAEPLPDGLAFSVDRGGRRWTISGTPTETSGPAQYTIRARAVIGSGPSTVTGSRKVQLSVAP